VIDYRPAAHGHVAGIDRIFRAAANELHRRHGFPEIPPGPPNPFYAFAIDAEGEGCWVAEEDGKVVGVSIASLREPAWFLAFLFINPACQARGIGRQLIERALAYGGHDAALRTLVTWAYNPASIGLYLRYGIRPLEPLYVFDAPVGEVQRRLAGARMLDSEVATGSDTAECLAAIDRSVLGMDRVALHRFLLGAPGNVCRIFRAGGAACGYAYVSAAGRVGPVAAAAPLEFGQVLETALSHAAAISRERVSAVLAGSNAAGLAAATECGMRITTPLLLMATRRFGDWDRYVFHSAGLM
jgi:GNAT superfamily N-acetyltransferase